MLLLCHFVTLCQIVRLFHILIYITSQSLFTDFMAGIMTVCQYIVYAYSNITSYRIYDNSENNCIIVLYNDIIQYLCVNKSKHYDTQRKS